ncbi:hypothetical protein PVAP13_3KG266290 [Panicum virgatum]|uniref:Uncharacterized protein n=1 Tax=Panicum virgatum TaxID=38727 RepID=A0A8T0UUF9_PANVG|nr:hypothetical protein PVAP13_3KG266290 [Panicum virgatum]
MGRGCCAPKTRHCWTPGQTGSRGGWGHQLAAQHLRRSDSPCSSAVGPIQHHHDDALVEPNLFCRCSSPLHRQTLPPTELPPAISSPAKFLPAQGPSNVGERLPETSSANSPFSPVAASLELLMC